MEALGTPESLAKLSKGEAHACLAMTYSLTHMMGQSILHKALLDGSVAAFLKVLGQEE